MKSHSRLATNPVRVVRRAGYIAAMLALWSISLVPNACAFDGRRHGFIIGGGLGAGYSQVTYKSRMNEPIASTLGFQSTFILGGGLSDQVTLSYTGLQFWGNFGDDDVDFALLPSLEVRYYLSPRAPSFFGALGFGPALYEGGNGSWGFDGGWSIEGGLAPHFGVGWEMIPHISAELNAAFAFGRGESHEPLWNLAILVTALAY